MPTAARNAAPRPLVLLLLLTLAPALAFAAPATQPADKDGRPPLYWHVHGAGDAFWLTAPEYGPDKSILTHVFTRGTAGNWRYLTQLASDVVSLSDHHNDLVALLRNGSWRTVYQGGSTLGRSPSNGTLVALAGNAQSLYGIVRTEGRYQVQVFGAAPQSTSPTTHPTTTTAATTQPNTTQPTAAAAQPAENQPAPPAPDWVPLADLPPDLSKGPNPVIGAAIVDGKLHVAGVLPDKQVAVFSLDNTTLRQLATFKPADDPYELKVIALGRRPAVWVSPGTTNGGAVYTAPDFDPEKRFPLGPLAGEVAVSSERIRLLHSQDPKKPDGGVPMETTWDYSGNQKSQAALGLPMGGGTVNQLYSFVLWGILAVAAIASLRRGMTRQTLFNAAQLPLAGRGKRFAAGAIDAAPFFVTVVALHAYRGFPTDPNVLLYDPAFIRWQSIGLAVAVLQPLVLELITGRSLGKFLFGLRVLGIDGAPARPGPVILRNLLRLIEYPLFFFLLMVFYTPLRQRLGDALASTIVVDDNKQPHVDQTA